jgi:hypothetical protein
MLVDEMMGFIHKGNRNIAAALMSQPGSYKYQLARLLKGVGFDMHLKNYNRPMLSTSLWKLPVISTEDWTQEPGEFKLHRSIPELKQDLQRGLAKVNEYLHPLFPAKYILGKNTYEKILNVYTKLILRSGDGWSMKKAKVVLNTQSVIKFMSKPKKPEDGNMTEDESDNNTLQSTHLNDFCRLCYLVACSMYPSALSQQKEVLDYLVMCAYNHIGLYHQKAS